MSWSKENLLAKKEKLATISKSAADKSGTTKKRQRDSDADSYGRPASTSRILNASPGSPNNKAPEDQIRRLSGGASSASTSRFSGMTLEEFHRHTRGLSIDELAKIYGHYR